ncbi:amidase [Aliifodinibius salipaludis]|uniref:Amidase n=1 Tax=Fodinibius salipaludis TaxID=2032627 RepID=A0A2A2GDT9_9BACT|nr:amidase [Aliifodinibius salipaludis]PAU95701.1 amidase [Aliifodinibius salipaludis]
MIKRLGTLFLGLFLGFLLAFTSVHFINDDITPKVVSEASKLIGIDFTAAERDSMIAELESNRDSYQSIRDLKLDNGIPPALNFNPIPPGKIINKTDQPIDWNLPEDVNLPDNRSDLAFYTVEELASLIKQQKISSVELTKFFLKRITQHGDTLEAIITVTEEMALEQAKKMDQELANGNYRGPLHGIPYGLKDLFAVEGYKTTWGAIPYKDQQINETATVAKKLEEAGAVLVAKTTLGALAFGDVWFDGKTRNPWNLEQGSSGSSAGSAAGTSAGLFPFAIGTETWGSIISPSNRTGTTGLRPTFGRVSRHGAMALSWSMDKVGPITRSVKDAALVFDAIHGPDGKDQTVFDLPFNYKSDIDVSDLKIGYLESALKSDYDNRQRDSLTLAKLEELGAELIPIQLPDYPVSDLSFILTAEGATAFDQLTLSNKDDEMVRQGKSAWPNLFRSARFIPAIEYIQANRARQVLIQKMDSVMQQVDMYVSPTYGGNNLLLTNLTGHPSVIVPNGFTDEGQPTSITFIGDLFDEGRILGVSQKYQQATDFHTKHPKMFTQ